jgi:hypothetical protein
MNLYFTFSSMPEVQTLPTSDRKRAYAECIHPLLMEWRVRLTKFVFAFLVFYGGYLLGAFGSIASYTVFFALYLVADHLFDICTIRLMRIRLAAAISGRLTRHGDTPTT